MCTNGVGIVGGLPFVSVVIEYRKRRVGIENVLMDTGSAGCIFPTDLLHAVGLTYEPEDIVHRIRGVGGSEFVFAKRVDRMEVGDLVVTDFEIEVGAMNYGFPIDGIIGTDFLTSVGCIIDLERFEIRKA